LFRRPRKRIAVVVAIRSMDERVRGHDPGKALPFTARRFEDPDPDAACVARGESLDHSSQALGGHALRRGRPTGEKASRLIEAQTLHRVIRLLRRRVARIHHLDALAKQDAGRPSS
jgi:hypothetical protein